MEKLFYSQVTWQRTLRALIAEMETMKAKRIFYLKWKKNNILAALHLKPMSILQNLLRDLQKRLW